MKSDEFLRCYTLKLQYWTTEQGLQVWRRVCRSGAGSEGGSAGLDQGSPGGGDCKGPDQSLISWLCVYQMRFVVFPGRPGHWALMGNLRWLSGWKKKSLSVRSINNSAAAVSLQSCAASCNTTPNTHRDTDTHTVSHLDSLLWLVPV